MITDFFRFFGELKEVEPEQQFYEDFFQGFKNFGLSSEVMLADHGWFGLNDPKYFEYIHDNRIKVNLRKYNNRGIIIDSISTYPKYELTLLREIFNGDSDLDKYITNVLDETYLEFHKKRCLFEIPHSLYKRKNGCWNDYATFDPQFIPEHIRQLYRTDILFENIVESKRKVLDEKIKEEVNKLM